MKTVVIGGCGHIGSYLVPMLIKAGHEVTVVSRGKSKSYLQDYAWKKAKMVVLDREKDADFAEKIAAMNADIVVDLISFHFEDTRKMVEALKPTSLSHYLFCSSIWAHGRVRTLEADPNDLQKEPLDDYGRNKFQSELYLKNEWRTAGFPATVIMPGQISGPGWLIINPWGNLNTKMFEVIGRGEKIYLPNLGMETLHHVHASDVAQMFFRAIMCRNQSLGESFHAVAENSMTLYGYARLIYEFFNQKPDIDFLSWEKWAEYEGHPDEVSHSYYHLARSGKYSIENAKRLIGYRPQFTVQETVIQSIQSYLDRGIIKI
jgi:nucleoside-diphosphate-sugar epimerase